MAAGGLSGACHCGGVAISLPSPPEYVARCNCSLCTKTGALWGYYDPADVQLTSRAPLQAYVRADIAEPCLSTDRCSTCGCIVQWHAIVPLDPPRMGVNINLFEPADIAGIEIRSIDGRSWPL